MLLQEALSSDLIEKMNQIVVTIKSSVLKKQHKSLKWIEQVLPNTYLYSRKKVPVYGVMVSLKKKTPQEDKVEIEEFIRSLSIVKDVPIERNDLMIKILLWEK